MYCNQCGNILAENAAFCTFCGAKNESHVAPSAPSEPPEASAPAAEPSAPVAEVPAAAPTANAAQTPIAAQTAPVPAKAEKTYTFNHILMCLAAVAVMAVVAGVFAGLYFSVI